MIAWKRRCADALPAHERDVPSHAFRFIEFYNIRAINHQWLHCKIQMNGPASDSQSSRIDMKAQLPGQPSVESESDTDEGPGGSPAGSVDDSAILAGVGLEVCGIGIGIAYDEESRKLISSLAPGGPAELCGLIKIGDVLDSVDARNVTMNSVERVMSFLIGPVGTVVTLIVVRDGTSISVELVRSFPLTPYKSRPATPTGPPPWLQLSGSAQSISRSPSPGAHLYTAEAEANTAEAKMLRLIEKTLEEEQNPRAVVAAMLAALPEKSQAKKEFIGRELDKHLEHLPISAALVMNMGIAVVRRLMVAFPETIRTTDSEQGRTLLHWAAGFNSDASVVSEIIRMSMMHGIGLFEKDKEGGLPLHVAAANNPNEKVIAALLEGPTTTRRSRHEAADEKDNDGRLPLHRAARFNSNEKVIEELQKAFPGAACRKDNDGLLPLHAAAGTGSNSNEKTLQQLLDAYLPVNVMDTKKHEHPLYACIILSSGLKEFSRHQRSKNVRLSNDTREKAAELEQLACSIARNREGTSNFGQEIDDCLQLAADLKMKFFISEPACSRRIEELWYSRQCSTRMFLGFIFFWISGLNFVLNVGPKHVIPAPPPLIRFLMNRVTYFVFLVCLLQLPLLASPIGPIDNIEFEIFLVYWLFDLCFSEAAEVRNIMKKYSLTALQAVARHTEDPWNVYDLIALSAAVAAAVVRGLAHAGTGCASASTSNQLYAWSIALLWGRLVNVLSIVSFIGPLLIMVLSMVFRDLSKFAFLAVLMELPFVAALYYLESGNAGHEEFSTFLESSLSFFKIVIGQGPDISSVSQSSSILLSIGSILLSVLLLNLLIAMFSRTFDTIIENSTQEYLLQKAQLTFTWMHAPRMPPPLTAALALRDWTMNELAKRAWPSGIFAKYCAGWVPAEPEKQADRRHGSMRARAPIRTESSKSFVEPAAPRPPTFNSKHFFHIVFPKKMDETEEVFLRVDPCVKLCDKVLDDFKKNAEFNAEAMKLQIAESSESFRTILDRVNKLSDAVLAQQALIQRCFIDKNLQHASDPSVIH
jgi:hypothetical protein